MGDTGEVGPDGAAVSIGHCMPLVLFIWVLTEQGTRGASGQTGTKGAKGNAGFTGDLGSAGTPGRTGPQVCVCVCVCVCARVRVCV